MIIKVQLSLVTNAQERQVLIYNEDRSFKYEGVAPEHILKMAGGQNKFFVETDFVEEFHKVGQSFRVLRDEEQPKW